MFRIRLGRSLSLAALTWLSLATATSLEAAVPELAQLKEAAQERGKLVLGEFQTFQGTYLSDVTIDTPHFSASGSITGTSKFAATNSEVLLQFLEAEKGPNQWVLAVKLPVTRLSDLCPALRGTPIDELRVNKPVVVFAQKPMRLGSERLDHLVRRLYEKSLSMCESRTESTY